MAKTSGLSPSNDRSDAQHDIPALDGFRAIAILIVMASHVGLEKILPGQFGVTLFFFLSGYLITTIMRREFERDGDVSLTAFYLRRMVRILPPMYLTILFAVLLSAVGLISALNYHVLYVDFLFLTNYFPISGIPIGLWSLAVEEHYYVLFPAFFLFFARRLPMAQLALICLLLCGLFLGVRLWEASRLTDITVINFWTHTRLDSILFGAILALWNNPVADERDNMPDRWGSYLLAGLLLLSTFVIRDEAFRQTYRYTLQGLGLFVLFNAAIRDRRLAGPLLDNIVMKKIALYSYTLYLVHVILIKLCEPLATVTGHPAAALLGVILSFLFAMVMHQFIEEPLHQWRRKTERKLRDRKAAVQML